jgi:hypothetical protein
MNATYNQFVYLHQLIEWRVPESTARQEIIFNWVCGTQLRAKEWLSGGAVTQNAAAAGWSVDSSYFQLLDGSSADGP